MKIRQQNTTALAFNLYELVNCGSYFACSKPSSISWLL